MTKKKIFFNSLFFISSLILIIYLLKQVSFEDIKVLLKEMSLLETACLIVIYMMNIALKGLRIANIISSNNLKRQSISISAVHNFMNHILPFRLGEFTVPVLYKAFSDKSFITSSFSLLVLRIYDLVFVALFFLFSLLMAFQDSKYSFSNAVLFLLIAIIIVLIFMLIFLRPFSNFFIKLTISILSLFFKSDSKLIKKIEDIHINLDEKVASISIINKYLILPLYSFLIWFSTYVMLFLVMFFLNIEVPFIKSILASSGAVITSILPINGVGSFGTLEAGWSIGYGLLGINKDDAIASGFIMHIIIVLAGFISAIMGFTFLVLRKKLRTNNVGK